MYLFNVEDVFVQIIKYICLKGELTGKHGKCHGLLQHLSVGRNVFGNIIEIHLARSGKYTFIICQIKFTKKERNIHILNSVVTSHSLEKELASKHGQVLAQVLIYGCIFHGEVTHTYKGLHSDRPCAQYFLEHFKMYLSKSHKRTRVYIQTCCARNIF